ncbi:MAG TPA: SRPBCC domain-containing protein [Gemmatimonadaceae bacterium]|jgi:hypothetical protein
MHIIETEIEIRASAERVWELLTEFASYPRWNPFVRSIEGELIVGKNLSVFIQPPGSRGMRFRPTLLAVSPTRELRWKGKLLLPGLFDGEHYFKLENAPNGGVLFRQGERFTGILVPLFRKSLDRATEQGFIAMNEAVKREAERA